MVPGASQGGVDVLRWTERVVVDGRPDERPDERPDGRIDGQIDGQIAERIDVQVGGDGRGSAAANDVCSEAPAMSQADRTLDEHRRRSSQEDSGGPSGPALSSGAVRAAGGADGAAAVVAPDVPALGVAADAHSVADDRVLAVGERCGEYAIEGLVGAGAFGSVYKGVHLLIGKPAAIKVLSLRHSVDPGIVARFVDEARAVNRIHRDGIINIFGFGRLDCAWATVPSSSRRACTR